MPATNTIERGDMPGSMFGGLGGQGFGSDSVPAHPLDKYFILRDSYLRNGKEWKWEKMRDYVREQYIEKGWPENQYLMKALDNIQDVDVDVAPERARMLRLDDREAKAEMEARAAADRQAVAEIAGASQGESELVALVRDLSAQVSSLKAQLGAQERQESARTVQTVQVTTDVSATALQAEIAKSEAAVGRTGLPDAGWTKKEMVEYANKNGIDVPDNLLQQFTPKAELLNHILDVAKTEQEGE